MNVLKLEQREEVIVLIEKQLKEQHDLAKENIDPVSFFFWDKNVSYTPLYEPFEVYQHLRSCPNYSYVIFVGI